MLRDAEWIWSHQDTFWWLGDTVSQAFIVHSYDNSPHLHSIVRGLTGMAGLHRSLITNPNSLNPNDPEGPRLATITSFRLVSHVSRNWHAVRMNCHAPSQPSTLMYCMTLFLLAKVQHNVATFFARPRNTQQPRKFFVFICAVSWVWAKGGICATGTT